MDLSALVPADITDLVPTFLQNRALELERLRDALAEEHFGLLQHYGERMYALGNPYGFRQITTFGRKIREACVLQDLATIGPVLDQYAEYLNHVVVTVVPKPLDRAQWTEHLRAEKTGGRIELNGTNASTDEHRGNVRHDAHLRTRRVGR
jgi:hypothetical protein